MDQQPNYRRRRIAFATAAVTLLAFSNSPDRTPVIGGFEITASDDDLVRMKATAAPLMVGAATFAAWATERLTR